MASPLTKTTLLKRGEIRPEMAIPNMEHEDKFGTKQAE
jgi:hypothetical protein